MKQYSHSKAFGELKATDEYLKSNLTSAQYLHTLDYFLWNALEPIITVCPNFFCNFAVKCASHQTLSPNSKYTSGDKTELPIALFCLLVEPNVKNARALYLNRGLTFGLIALYLDIAHPYVVSVERRKSRNRKAHMAQAQQLLGALAPLYAPTQTVKHWVEKAQAWKNIIIEKYTRLTLLMAQRTYVDYGHALELDDVVQVYLLIMSKAIDRCDSRMGVLTTFIQQWMKSARARVATMVQAQNNESLESLHDELGDSFTTEHVNPDNSAEVMETLSYTAMLADPQGLVRTSMGIPQYMNNKYREILGHYIK